MKVRMLECIILYCVYRRTQRIFSACNVTPLLLYSYYQLVSFETCLSDTKSPWMKALDPYKMQKSIIANFFSLTPFYRCVTFLCATIASVVSECDGQLHLFECGYEE